MAQALGARLAALRGGAGPDEAMHRVVTASARTGAGLEELRARVDEMLDLDRVSEVTLHLPAGEGAALHMIHEYGNAREIRYDESGVWVVADLPESIRRRLRQYVRHAQPGAAPSAALL
jgi:50S ribosomal subunit-associated GTPase HflX